jgi:uncharacterized membrane protein
MSSTAFGDQLSVEPPIPVAQTRPRLDSVDLLRGLVMVLMALDHVRDFFTELRFDPTNLSQTTVPLFFTRWITHFCAPTFVFLAGAGAFLQGARGKGRSELAGFLVTRGLWLVVLELTVVRLGWAFDLNYAGLLWVQVIWVIGVSMVVLAGLVYLPLPVIAAFGLVMITTHNLFDGITPESLGGWGPLWTVLHVQRPVTLPGGGALFVAYPLIPWIGVMAAGYAFGSLLLLPTEERRRLMLRLGLALTAAFIVLRALNIYGDPRPWTPQPTGVLTLLSFLNTTKYPPSLAFLLMTLGPAIASLAWFERLSGTAARFLIVFGRVPLFYYVLHIFLIHAVALALGVMAGFPASTFLKPFFLNPPAGWGYGMPAVYALWVAVVLALYPVCRWYAGLKARRRDAWLSYL